MTEGHRSAVRAGQTAGAGVAYSTPTPIAPIGHIRSSHSGTQAPVASARGRRGRRQRRCGGAAGAVDKHGDPSWPAGTATTTIATATPITTTLTAATIALHPCKPPPPTAAAGRAQWWCQPTYIEEATRRWQRPIADTEKTERPVDGGSETHATTTRRPLGDGVPHCRSCSLQQVVHRPDPVSQDRDTPAAAPSTSPISTWRRGRQRQVATSAISVTALSVPRESSQPCRDGATVGHVVGSTG